MGGREKGKVLYGQAGGLSVGGGYREGKSRRLKDSASLKALGLASFQGGYRLGNKVSLSALFCVY